MGMARCDGRGRCLRRLPLGGPLRRREDVLHQQPQGVWNTFETRNAAHVHDVRCPFTFDYEGTPYVVDMCSIPGYMSTTYGVPSLSIMSTPYRSIPKARPQLTASSRNSGV